MTMIPLPINFDYAPGRPLRPDIVHLPKIYQGAPFDNTIRLKNATTGEYRDFTGYDEIKMQVRLAQAKAPLFELTQSAGQLVGTIDGFRIQFAAAVTEALALPMRPDAQINEVPFVHDIELIRGGVVVERLAQGVGVIVVNTTR